MGNCPGDLRPMKESDARPGWTKGTVLLVTLIVSSTHTIGVTVLSAIGYVSLRYKKGWIAGMLMRRAVSAAAGT